MRVAPGMFAFQSDDLHGWRHGRAPPGDRSVCKSSGSANIADDHARVERAVRVLENELGTRTCAMQRPGRKGAEVAANSCTPPDVGSISRKARRPTVDLPQPDSPTSASVSPAATVKETLSAARTTAVASLTDEQRHERFDTL